MQILQGALRSPELIVARTVTTGLRAMELGGGSPRRRRWVWAVRRGEAVLSTVDGFSVVPAGSVAVGAEATTRLHETSENCDLVQLAYGEAPTEELTVCRWSAAEEPVVAALAEALGPAEPDVKRARVAVAHFADAFGRTALASSLAKSQTPSAYDLRTASAVAELTSRLEAHPGVDDLAIRLEAPPRRASEMAASYFRRHHASFSGWRSYVGTLRVELGLAALRTRRVRSAHVARWLGYRSAPALYHALERRGVSPSAWAEGEATWPPSADARSAAHRTSARTPG